MKTLLALILLLLCSCEPAYAEFSGFVGIGKGTFQHQPFERTASLGYTFHGGDTMYAKPQVGGWIGGAGVPSYYLSVPMGVEVWIPNTGAYCFLGVGPAWISNTDTELSSNWEFNPEFGCGLQGGFSTVGVKWVHFSNGGLKLPNQGRDMVGLFFRLKEF
jgi:hypothetical protein